MAAPPPYVTSQQEFAAPWPRWQSDVTFVSVNENNIFYGAVVCLVDCRKATTTTLLVSRGGNRRVSDSEQVGCRRYNTG